MGYPWIPHLDWLPGPKYSNKMRPPNYKLVVETDCRFFSPLKTQAIRQVIWATFFHPNSIAIPTFVFHVSVFCIVYRLSHLWYPLVMTNIAIENDHLWWIFPLNMVIFHSYVNVYQRVIFIWSQILVLVCSPICEIVQKLGYMGICWGKMMIHSEICGTRFSNPNPKFQDVALRWLWLSQLYTIMIRDLSLVKLEIPWFDYPKMYPWEYLRWLLVYCYIPWKLQLSIAHKVLPQIVVSYTTLWTVDINRANPCYWTC